MTEPWLASFYPDFEAGTPDTNCLDHYLVPNPSGWEHADVSVDASYTEDIEGNTASGNYQASLQGDAVIKLYTGGKAGVNQQNLWGVTGSATEYDVLDPSTRWEDISWGSASIPYEQITMGDLGPLGNDGIRWAVLPNDTTKTITPKTQSGQYVIYQASATKYNLVVTANGINLADDQVESGAKFCVGQYVLFSPVWGPPLPSGTVVSPVLWNFGGNFVNESWQAQCPGEFPCGSINFRTDFALLQNLTTAAWWLSGGDPATQYEATVAENLSFPNGQQETVVGHGKFGMYRPTTPIWKPLNVAGTPQIIITGGRLSFGDTSGSPPPGMSFQHYIKSDFDGVAGYTQLISGDFVSDLDISTSGFELDALQWPRGQKDISSTSPLVENGVSYDDQPSVSLATLNNITAMDLSFKTYLRFRPNAGDPNNNIFVTLRLVTWTVTASATKNVAGVWSVDSTSSYSGPNNSDSTELPVWTETFN